MVAMRLWFLLAAVLTLTTPSVAWSPIEVSAVAGASMSMAAPSPSASQILRAVAAKSDKIFSHSAAIITDARPLFPPTTSTCVYAIGHVDPPNLDLDSPPLAPRPPPRNS